MIKAEDYIIVDDFGYNCICKVVFPGMNKNIRRVSIQAICPDNIGKDAFSIIIDVKKVIVLTPEEINIVKDIYET